MLILVLISCGFAVLCCAAAAVPVVLLVRLAANVRSRSVLARLVVFALAAASAMWAAYWCLLIARTSWSLVTESGGPGPYGLLIFPFWAALAATPALLGWVALSALRRRQR